MVFVRERKLTGGLDDAVAVATESQVLRSRHMLHRTHLLLVMLVAFIAFASTVGVANGQDVAQDSIRLELLRDPGNIDAVPLEVELTSPRAIEGTLLVRNHNLNMVWELPIAVAANTPIREVITMPVSSSRIDIEATLEIDGDEVASERIRNVGGAAAENAVGLLGVENELSSVEMSPAIGQAALVPLTDFALLPALDSVVASPSGLADLTTQDRADLFLWVATGRQLLVAGDPGSIDQLLPLSLIHI